MSAVRLEQAYEAQDCRVRCHRDDVPIVADTPLADSTRLTIGRSESWYATAVRDASALTASGDFKPFVMVMGRSPGSGHGARVVLSGKIQGCHLDCIALVYVRHSMLQQLEQHRESTRVQYALADRPCRLGWPRSRVTVIDDDLGCSGASTSGRPGFQRLVAEVGLEHVALCSGLRSRAWPAPAVTGIT